MGDKCVKTSLLLNISTSPEAGGADREPVGPALEATVSWLRQAGVLRAADKAVWLARGWGRGGGGQHGRGDVSFSQPKLPSLGWLICILLCIHLHATFWKGLIFFKCCLSLISRVSLLVQ